MKLFDLFAKALKATATFQMPGRKSSRLPTRSNMRGSPRRAPAVCGGNWQGKGYLSYSERDKICREILALRNDQYDQVLTRKHIRQDWEHNACWLKTQPKH